MIFNIDKETMPREKIREIQLSRLQDLCRRVYANVPFYRRSFDEKGIKPSDVQSLDDLKFLPFTLKQDMRNNYPYGLFAVPMEMIQRIHASSGTTGKATVPEGKMTLPEMGSTPSPARSSCPRAR